MMHKILSFLLSLLLFSFVLGPLGKLPLDFLQGGIYVTDIIVVLLCLFWLFHISVAVSLLRQEKVAQYVAFFSAIASLSLLLSPIPLSLFEKLVSLGYLVRFLAYFGIYITMKYLLREKKPIAQRYIRYLGYAGVILALIGWFQYILYPDLRNLYYLGWDPHYKRIFGTYLDPNFLGLLLTLSLIFFFFEKKLSRISRTGAILFLGVTLAFTYSRSSFLAFLSALLFLSLNKKNMWIIGIGFFLFLLSILFLPRPGGEGVKLERVFSITQRIESWKLGFSLFIRHPLTGVGFNTLRFAKKEYGFVQEDWITNHAGAGIENSFLFLGATVGIFGLLAYCGLLWCLFMRGNLFVRTSLIAICAHSFFLNSLFFSWIMMWMWILAAKE